MNRDIIVIGASAGGVEALLEVVHGLPGDLPAAVFVVLHIPPESRSMLPAILSRAGTLPATHADDGERIEKGHIYVAPPDYHLLIQPGYVHLDHGAAENRHRPAIDPLFRTAAEVYANRVIGVVLSGMLDDGTAGLAVIKACGGVAIAQDPATTLYRGMPENAIAHVQVDHIVPLTEISKTLVALSAESIEFTPDPPAADPESTNVETEIMGSASADSELVGKPSEFACPTCGGVLWEEERGATTHFRCRVGHAFSPQSLLAEQAQGMEEALWAALRALEERKSLIERLAARARERGQEFSVREFEAQIKRAEHDTELIKELIEKGLGRTVPESQ